MAASLSSHNLRWTITQNADINVTPFVDVMLVLLIIFMVAIPVSTVSVKVDLPPTQASADPATPPVIVTLALDGRLYIRDRVTTLAALPAATAAAAGGSPHETRVYLRADQGVSYGAFMRVMNRLRAEGFGKIALIGEEL